MSGLSSRLGRVERELTGGRFPHRVVQFDLKAAKRNPEGLRAFLGEIERRGLLIVELRGIDRQGFAWTQAYAEHATTPGHESVEIAGRRFEKGGKATYTRICWPGRTAGDVEGDGPGELAEYWAVEYTPAADELKRQVAVHVVNAPRPGLSGRTGPDGRVIAGTNGAAPGGE